MCHKWFWLCELILYKEKLWMPTRIHNQNGACFIHFDRLCNWNWGGGDFVQKKILRVNVIHSLADCATMSICFVQFIFCMIVSRLFDPNAAIIWTKRFSWTKHLVSLVISAHCSNQENFLGFIDERNEIIWFKRTIKRKSIYSTVFNILFLKTFRKTIT